MGNRVKGKPKRKSVKAAIGSNAGSKRKLSRMGKRQKREHAGLEASFIGRSACLKLLQVTLKDFRRLCILKGIYPREPLGRTPGNKKKQSFYHIKDIRAIAHEPIMEKFREFRAYMKKVRRAAGRNERDEALRKNELVPTYTLHHLVKERYPRFGDALADVDDALTLIYLFAALPVHSGIKASVIRKAKSLAAAWGAYCATTSAVTKAFVSVKGVYMEAVIQNATVRWVIPHAFTQFLPEDVDYRVMATFFEFYETLINFVLFKLYNDSGVRYPFSLATRGGELVGSTSAILGANLRALTDAFCSTKGAVSHVVSAAIEEKQLSQELEQGVIDPKLKVLKRKEKALIHSIGTALDNLVEVDDQDDDDSVDVAGPLQAALETMAEQEGKNSRVELDDDATKRRRLFQGMTFFLSREVPRGYLELVCLAFGGKVGWEDDDSPVSLKDPSITHHLVDRPKLPTTYNSLPKSREFVQPQWLLDSANFSVLLPVARYIVGATLPPHLSPWVDHEEEGYTPKYAEEIERYKNGESVDFAEDDVLEVDVSEVAAIEDELDEGDEGAPVEESEADEGHPGVELVKVTSSKRKKQRKSEDEEAHELAKSMMNRKAAHLYGRMQHGLARKQEKVDALQQRRREIETRSKAKDDSGKTPLKQKVERLKKERQSIEKDYDDTGGTMKKARKGRS